ncbi:DnaJ domain [Melia azedarach]|uniref:DnaJ domain n=1 Tax=Melia azedarach TaxID=155640 RepID=A0ACC1WZ20_MELAZ|nr:DnaJ domain [Melia azedarach]
MLTNLVKLAAEKAKGAAEEYFKLQNVDMAIKSLQAAKDFSPRLPNIEEYFAYKVHELAAKKSTWYEILAITDPEVDTSVIRKQYKRLALMLHPDKNPSVAADGAFKLIQSALDILRIPEKRDATTVS